MFTFKNVLCSRHSSALSERRVEAVKSGSLRCTDEFKQQENKSSEYVRRQANLLS